MKRGFTLLLGIFIIVIFLFLIPLSLIVFNLLYALPVYDNLILKAMGFVLLIFGLSATLYSINFHLLTGRITPVAMEKPKKFIDKGFYGYSRNPMYISILVMLFGGFLILGHVLLLIYTILAIPAVHLFVVYKEEPELKRLFGKEYEDYMKKVPRWLPKFSE